MKQKRHFLCQIESLAANAASLKGNFWSRWRDAINNFAKVVHLRLLCICIINQFFTQQQGSREKEWKGSIHQLVFLTFGVRMNADCHCSETGEKNSLYCKEKTTAATLFRPQHLSPFALLQQWMTTSELLAQEKPKMKTASLCKILLTSLKLCGLWLIAELNDRSLAFLLILHFYCSNVKYF